MEWGFLRVRWYKKSQVNISINEALFGISLEVLLELFKELVLLYFGLYLLVDFLFSFNLPKILLPLFHILFSVQNNLCRITLDHVGYVLPAFLIWSDWPQDWEQEQRVNAFLLFYQCLHLFWVAILNSKYCGSEISCCKIDTHVSMSLEDCRLLGWRVDARILTNSWLEMELKAEDERWSRMGWWVSEFFWANFSKDAWTKDSWTNRESSSVSMAWEAF
jgi:hypothetical protein